MAYIDAHLQNDLKYFSAGQIKSADMEALLALRKLLRTNEKVLKQRIKDAADEKYVQALTKRINRGDITSLDGVGLDISKGHIAKL